MAKKGGIFQAMGNLWRLLVWGLAAILVFAIWQNWSSKPDAPEGETAVTTTENPAEEPAGEAIEEAATDVTDAVEEAVEGATAEAESAAEKLNEAAQDAAEKLDAATTDVNERVENAGNALKKVIEGDATEEAN